MIFPKIVSAILPPVAVISFHCRSEGVDTVERGTDSIPDRLPLYRDGEKGRAIKVQVILGAWLRRGANECEDRRDTGSAEFLLALPNDEGRKPGHLRAAHGCLS